MKYKFQELAERQTQGIWWAPAMNRWHDQTGVAHVVHNNGMLCGARPYSCGGSFQSAAEAGAKECQRCRAILDRAATHTPTGGTQ